MDANFVLLVEKARDGDREAYGRIIRQQWPGLVAFARSLVGEAEAEDLVQESLVQAWKKLSGLREASALGSWLRKLTLRRCLRALKRRPQQTEIEKIPELSREEDHGLRIDVEKILRRLSPRQRAVIFLTEVEGLTDSEIASVLGISASSVRGHRKRARAAVGRILEGSKA